MAIRIGLSRGAFGIALTVAMLAGCGQAQTVGTGMMPQGAAPAEHAAHGKSWMLPEAKGEALVYANNNADSINVYSYKTGKQLGNITGLSGAYGECSDIHGNVFVTNSYNADYTYEYAHAGITPKATFETTGYAPQSCSVDPTTGNLAICADSSHDAVAAIFKNEQESPTLYEVSTGALFCAYDNNGNLFVDGGTNSSFALQELAKGASAFMPISIYGASGWFHGSIQWDGSALAVNIPHGTGSRGPSVVYQVQISGSQGTVIGTTKLYSRRTMHNYSVDCQLWIQEGRILAGQRAESELAAWLYPAGGKPKRIYKPGGGVCGITVSVHQSHK